MFYWRFYIANAVAFSALQKKYIVWFYFIFVSFQLAKEESLTQLASDLKSFTNNKEIFSTDVKEISKLMQGMLSRLGSSGVDHTIDMWHREQIYKELLLVSSKKFCDTGTCK